MRFSTSQEEIKVMTHAARYFRVTLLLVMSGCCWPAIAPAQDDPASWRLTRDLIVRSDGSPASEDARYLLSELAAAGKEGEPVTQDELLSLLDNTERQLVSTTKWFVMQPPRATN